MTTKKKDNKKEELETKEFETPKMETPDLETVKFDDSSMELDSTGFPVSSEDNILFIHEDGLKYSFNKATSEWLEVENAKILSDDDSKEEEVEKEEILDEKSEEREQELDKREQELDKREQELDEKEKEEKPEEKEKEKEPEKPVVQKPKRTKNPNHLVWKKTGGGSLRFKIGGKKRIIKPGETFECREDEIPNSFRDSIICLSTEELKSKHKAKIEELKKPEILYEVQQRKPGWFDVVNLESKKRINERALRKEEADELLISLKS